MTVLERKLSSLKMWQLLIIKANKIRLLINYLHSADLKGSVMVYGLWFIGTTIGTMIFTTWEYNPGEFQDHSGFGYLHAKYWTLDSLNHPPPHTHQKNSTWIKNQNVRANTINKTFWIKLSVNLSHLKR